MVSFGHRWSSVLDLVYQSMHILAFSFLPTYPVQPNLDSTISRLAESRPRMRFTAQTRRRIRFSPWFKESVAENEFISVPWLHKGQIYCFRSHHIFTLQGGGLFRLETICSVCKRLLPHRVAFWSGEELNSFEGFRLLSVRWLSWELAWWIWTLKSFFFFRSTFERIHNDACTRNHQEETPQRQLNVITLLLFCRGERCYRISLVCAV